MLKCKANFAGVVESIAVVEHQREIVEALLPTVIHALVKLLANGGEIHRVLDDIEIILQKTMLIRKGVQDGEESKLGD